jgi:hypothetical protein
MSVYTDGRLKRVMGRFIDLQSRQGYLADFFTYLGDASAGSYDVPSIAASTIGTTRTRSAPGVDTLTPNNMVLNQEPALKSLLPHRDPESLLEGRYFESLADQKFYEIKNVVDNDLNDALWKTAAVAAAGDNTAAHDGGNVRNKSLSAITLTLIGQTEAALVANGFSRSNFMWQVAPNAYAQMRALSDLVPAFGAAEGANLGIPNVSHMMTVNGIPVMESPALPNTIEVAGTASQTGTTVTFVPTAAGAHGLQTGMVGKIVSASITDDTANAITVNAAGDSITVTADGSDTVSSEAATLVIAAAPALLFDRTKAYYAGDLVPSVRVVPDSESISDVLQIGIKYGKFVYGGNCRVLLFPNS